MKKAKLIVIGGFSGAGKTTISRMLAKITQHTLISTDEIVHTIKNELKLTFHEAAPAGFEVLWTIVKTQLSQGNSVIADVNMCHEASWKNLYSLKEAFPNVEVLIFILECSLETHKKRFEQRTKENLDPNNQESDTFEEMLYKYKLISSYTQKDAIKINTETGPKEVLNAIQEKL